MRSPVPIKAELSNAEAGKADIPTTGAADSRVLESADLLPAGFTTATLASADQVGDLPGPSVVANVRPPNGDGQSKAKTEIAFESNAEGARKQEQGLDTLKIVPDLATTDAGAPSGAEADPQAASDPPAQLLDVVPPPRRPSPRTLPVDFTPRVTIAERRAMVLPPSTVSLSSPFDNGKVRRDPRPTAGSAADTNEADSDYGPRAVKKARKAQPKLTNAERLAVLVGGIKLVQQKPDTIDVETPLADNVGTKREDSSRAIADISGEDSILHASHHAERRSSNNVDRVGRVIAADLHKATVTDASLRMAYHELQKEWDGHCEYLDALMAKRGPPPPDLYAIPSSLLPPLPPPAGPLPITPVEEFPTRGSRRRGGGIYGDMVSTEADFEAILAEFADDAAKDPNLRASKTTAVVPDMMTLRERKLAYDDENDIVDDPLEFYDHAGTAEPIWTDEERMAFQKRYLTYPKQFGKIAEVLENKTAAQCVAYYYRTKKNVDYKGMLASKRGDKKKKGLPIKSSGKSSALLSNLGQQKPTVNSGSTPGPRSNIIPSSKKDETASVRRKPRESAASTPGVESSNGRRKKSDAVEEGAADNSAGPSRAGSETPSLAKSKMRMSIKGAKRPRISSVTEFPPLTTVPAVIPPVESSAAVAATATGVAGVATTATATTTAAMGIPSAAATPGDLLPPMKRSGKRRKVDPNDPNAPPEEKVAEPRPGRRPTTNSYWSVEEKKKFRELVVSHGTDAKAIAAELVGKSERQVQNFWEAHKEDMNLDFLAKGGEEAWAEVRRVNGATEKPDTKPVSAASRMGAKWSNEQAMTIGQGQPASYGRSIYDVYSGRRPSEAFEQRFAEPRLGMFPPTAQPTRAGANDVPDAAPVSRSGGMRISALLNDEPTASLHRDPSPVKLPSMSLVTRDVDAASDGTVSERDAEGGIMTRPSPRGIPPVPGPAYSGSYDPTRAPDAYDRRDSQYRASTAQPAPYPAEHSGYYGHQPPPRASTAAPTLPPRQYEYGREPHPHSYYSHPPPHHSRSYPPPQAAQAPHPGHPPQPPTLHATHQAHVHPSHSAPPPSRHTQPHPSHAPHPAHSTHSRSPPLVHAQQRQYQPAPAHEWRREESRPNGPPGPSSVPPPSGHARPTPVYDPGPNASAR